MQLRTKFPHLVTRIVPRHPERGAGIAEWPDRHFVPGELGDQFSCSMIALLCLVVAILTFAIQIEIRLEAENVALHRQVATLAILMHSGSASRAHGRMDTAEGSSARSDGSALTTRVSERHLRYLLRIYGNYYNQTWTHLSLNKDAPVSRAIQTVGRILPVPILGGLHLR